MILHTRTIRRGGWLGVGGKTIIEITASRDINVLPATERRALMGPHAPARGRNPELWPPWGSLRIRRPAGAAAAGGVGGCLRFHDPRD